MVCFAEFNSGRIQRICLIYNTIPPADQLVLDAVNVGVLVFRKLPEQKIKDAIHSFVCNYGLLGMMTALPTTPKFVEYEKVYLLKNQYIREESTKWAHILRRDADVRKEEISAASIGEFHVNLLFLLQQKSNYDLEGFPFKP